jgi:hypothetical protein
MAEKKTNPVIEAAKRIPAQAVFGGADLLNLIIGAAAGKGLAGFTRKSPSETINQDILGLSEPELLSIQGGTELAAGFMNPAKAIAATAKTAGVAIPSLLSMMQRAAPAPVSAKAMSQAGAIRPGGAADLNMFHATPSGFLLQAIEEGRTFTAPSIAITTGRVNPYANSSSVNLLMNPRYEGFDPATSKSQLTNRDMYASRDKEPDRPGLAGEDLKLTEKANTTLQHALSIMLSPSFKSFKQFEDSPLGARVLRNYDFTKDYKRVKEASTALDDALQSVPELNFLTADRSVVYQDDVNAVLDVLREAASKGSTKARTAIAKLSILPANYGELKSVDELPINRETVSAIFTPQGLSREFSKHLEDKIGVPTGTPIDLLKYLPGAQDRYYELSDNLAAELGRLKVNSSGAVYSKIFSEPYLTKVSYNDVMDADSADILEDIVMNSLFSSDKFASDIASIYSKAD